MSERNDRSRTETAPEDETLRDDDAAGGALLDEDLEAELTADEPFPQGPNEDSSFGASPPVEASTPRTSDDDDLDPEGGGLRATPLRGPYEAIARRNDLARRLEELLTDVQEWASEDGSEAAAWIAETLADAYEQLDTPPEDTDAEPEIEEAEASDLGGPRSTGRGLDE